MLKKFFTLFMPIMVVATLVNAQSSGNTYTGNGANGFNQSGVGSVGGAILTITNTNTRIDFTLQTSGLGSDILVLYFDTKSGGYANTSSFNDRADNGRKAISGSASSTVRTTVTFVNTPPVYPAFLADYAIAVEPTTSGNGFAGIFDLSTPNNFGYNGSAGLTVNTDRTVLTFSINKSDIGITSTSTSFTFVGTLISNTAYRSNETFANSTTTPDPSNTATAPNAGFTGTTTFNAYNTFTFPSILPLKLISFSGKNNNGSVVLNWVTNNENGVQNFVIEGSTNATEWRSMATVAAKNTAKAEYAQVLTDAANTFYRLKMIDKDGKTTYSAVINLKSVEHSIKLITNPVIGAVRLSINADAAKYTNTLYSMDGKAIATTTYNHPGGVSTYEMPLNSVAKGNYLLKIASATETKTFNVLVQ